MNYPGSLPQGENINAVMLNQEPGAADAYQTIQAAQQMAKRSEVNADIATAQNISAISGMAKAASAGQSTPENLAEAYLQNFVRNLQSLTPGGTAAKDALAQNDPREVMKRIYG